MRNAEGRSACISAAKERAAKNPWARHDSSPLVQIVPARLPPSIPKRSKLPVPIGDNRLTVITDLPTSIAISAAELDILESHFGEVVRSLLAGTRVDDPVTA
jgi:hypothetical protein